jgi:hypothetical protein
MGGGGHLFALFEERGIFIDCCGRKSQVFVWTLQGENSNQNPLGSHKKQENFQVATIMPFKILQVLWEVVEFYK